MHQMAVCIPTEGLPMCDWDHSWLQMLCVVLEYFWWILKLQVPDDNISSKALVPLISCPHWKGLWGQNPGSVPDQLLRIRASPFPNPSTYPKTELRHRLLKNRKEIPNCTGDSDRSQKGKNKNLSNKKDLGQKQLSKTIKALDWKANCSKSFA